MVPTSERGIRTVHRTSAMQRNKGYGCDVFRTRVSDSYTGLI